MSLVSLEVNYMLLFCTCKFDPNYNITSTVSNSHQHSLTVILTIAVSAQCCDICIYKKPKYLLQIKKELRTLRQCLKQSENQGIFETVSTDLHVDPVPSPDPSTTAISTGQSVLDVLHVSTTLFLFLIQGTKYFNIVLVLQDE